VRRNTSCPQYAKCLSHYAHQNALPDAFDCSQCEHLHDHQPIDPTDYIGSLVLICALFKPELYREFQGWRRAAR